jgi:hypothetical protein
MSDDRSLTRDSPRSAVPGWPAALLSLVERMELQWRHGAIDPALLREAARLLPPGPTADTLRLELFRLARGPAAVLRPTRFDVCTISSRNYLPRALALLESLDRVQAGGHRLHVLCLDDASEDVMARLGHPQVFPVPLRKLERHDPALAAVRSGRSLSEYSWTLKASLLLFLLGHQPDIEVLTYLDADLFFFSPLSRVLDELEDGSILIHRHNFSPEHAHLDSESGTFNAGMVAFRNDAGGKEVLRWWRERCLEWCFARSEDGRFADQTYLNAWPSQFPGVSVARSAGVGVALWNHRNGTVEPGPHGEPHLAGEPIAFYHAHDLAMMQPGLVVPAKNLVYRLTLPLLQHCYLPYARALDRAQLRLRELSTSWSLRPEFEGLTANHAIIARRELRDPLRRAGLRHPIAELDASWDCHLAPQVTPENRA